MENQSTANEPLLTSQISIISDKNENDSKHEIVLLENNNHNVVNQKTNNDNNNHQRVTFAIRFQNKMSAAGPYMKHWWRVKWHHLLHSTLNLWRYGTNQPNDLHIDRVILLHIRQPCVRGSCEAPMDPIDTIEMSNLTEDHPIRRAILCAACDVRSRSHVSTNDITKTFVRYWLNRGKGSSSSYHEFDECLEQWIHEQHLCDNWHCGWHFVQLTYRTSVHHKPEQQRILLFGGNDMDRIQFPTRSTITITTNSKSETTTTAIKKKKSLVRKQDKNLKPDNDEYYWVIPDFEPQNISSIVKQFLNQCHSFENSKSLENETFENEKYGQVRKSSVLVSADFRQSLFCWLQCSKLLHNTDGSLYKNDQLLF